MEYSISQRSTRVESTLFHGPHSRGLQNFWDGFLLPAGLPLLLGLALGPLLAFLIVNEIWMLVLPLVLVVPMVALIVRYPLAAIVVWMVVMPWFPFDGTYKYVHFTVHRLLIPMAFNIFGMLSIRNSSQFQRPI